MASFFDSPLFWILLVWWILSAFLGSKARRRRMMRARSEAPAEPAADLEPPRGRVKPEPALPWQRPQETETETEVLTEEPPPTGTYPYRTLPERPVEPVMPMQDLLRKLGLSEELIPKAVRPVIEEPEPEEMAEPLPDIEAEEEPEAAPIEPAPVEAPVREVKKPVSPVAAHPLLPGTVLTGLTPMQQAILLREVLGPPRALQMDIR